MEAIVTRNQKLDEVEAKANKQREEEVFVMKRQNDGSYVKTKKVPEKEKMIKEEIPQEEKKIIELDEGEELEDQFPQEKGFQGSSSSSKPVHRSIIKRRYGRCACMGLTDRDIFHLVDCLYEWENIEELDIRGNRIGDEGLQQLVAGLSNSSRCPNLKRLRVGDNEGGEMGAQVLIGLSFLRKELEVDAEGLEENERSALTEEAESALAFQPECGKLMLTNEENNNNQPDQISRVEDVGEPLEGKNSLHKAIQQRNEQKEKLQKPVFVPEDIDSMD